ncbi:MAG: hypothetical protein LBN42_02425 [Oscillospiraceae bacterium]|jgi:chitinase|nr:hypothetical protein [Oscillospiraceae bacterium]
MKLKRKVSAFLAAMVAAGSITVPASAPVYAAKASGASVPYSLAANGGYRSVTYYGDWSIYDGSEDYFWPAAIPADQLTHINIAFLDLDKDGNVLATDPYAQYMAPMNDKAGTSEADESAQLSYWTTVYGLADGGDINGGMVNGLIDLRNKYPNLRLGISVGGWSKSGDFSDVTADNTKRANAVANLVKITEVLNLDFIDIDWEYPGSYRKGDLLDNSNDEGTPNARRDDGKNFVEFLKDLKTAQNALALKTGKIYELSSALTSTPSNFLNGALAYLPNNAFPSDYDIKKGRGQITATPEEWRAATTEYVNGIFTYLDFGNLMTYDLRGTWDNTTGHHTALYSHPEKDFADIAGTTNADANDAELVNFSADNLVQFLLGRKVDSVGNTIIGRLDADHDAFDLYIDSTVSSRKLVIGAAYYSYGWGNAKPASGEFENTDFPGLFQITHEAEANADGSKGTGAKNEAAVTEGDGGYADGKWTYNHLLYGGTDSAGKTINSIFDVYPNIQEKWDDTAKASYLYSADGVFITYDSKQSVAAKADYVKANNLGGIITWMASEDHQDSNKIRNELTNTINQGLWGSTPLQNFELAPAYYGDIAVTGSGSTITIKNNNKVSAKSIKLHFPNAGSTGNGLDMEANELLMAETVGYALMAPVIYITLKSGTLSNVEVSVDGFTFKTLGNNVYTVSIDTNKAGYGTGYIGAGETYTIKLSGATWADVEKVEIAERVYDGEHPGYNTEGAKVNAAVGDPTPSKITLAAAVIEFENGVGNYEYTGKAIEPNYTVKIGNDTLTEGTDYTGEYHNNTDVGAAYVEITGKGKYEGTKQLVYSINKDVPDVTTPSTTAKPSNTTPSSTSETGETGDNTDEPASSDDNTTEPSATTSNSRTTRTNSNTTANTDEPESTVGTDDTSDSDEPPVTNEPTSASGNTRTSRSTTSANPDTTAAPSSTVIGDIDANGEFELLDIVLGKQLIAGWSSKNSQNVKITIISVAVLKIADMDGSANLDIYDIILLQFHFINGTEDIPPPPPVVETTANTSTTATTTTRATAKPGTGDVTEPGTGDVTEPGTGTTRSSRTSATATTRATTGNATEPQDTDETTEPQESQEPQDTDETTEPNNTDDTTASRTTPPATTTAKQPSGEEVDNSVQEKLIANGRRVIGYYTDWDVVGELEDDPTTEDIDESREARPYTEEDIPWGKLTHINYSFGILEGNKLSLSKVDIDKLTALVAKRDAVSPNTKLLISVGGASDSPDLVKFMLAGEKAWQEFADSCVDFLNEYGFDGIDMDIEYPSALWVTDTDGDAHYTFSDTEVMQIYPNFVKFIHILRTTLNNASAKENRTGAAQYLLTAAVAPSAWNLRGQGDSEYAWDLDFVNIMTYDFYGPWSEHSWHNSAIYGTETEPEMYNMTDEGYTKPYDPAMVIAYAVEYWKSVLPAERITIGAPYYLQMWTNSNGLGSTATGNENESSVPMLWDLYNIIGKDGNEYFRDEGAKVPYVYNADTKTFYTFEDEWATEEKIKYILAQGLGGYMTWELSGDFSLLDDGKTYDRGDTLITIAANGLANGAAVKAKVAPTALADFKIVTNALNQADENGNAQSPADGVGYPPYMTLTLTNNTGKAWAAGTTITFQTSKYMAILVNAKSQADWSYKADGLQYTGDEWELEGISNTVSGDIRTYTAKLDKAVANGGSITFGLWTWGLYEQSHETDIYSKISGNADGSPMPKGAPWAGTVTDSMRGALPFAVYNFTVDGKYSTQEYPDWYY